MDFVAQIITVVDPLTGKARMIFGSDSGVGTFVSESSGLLNEVNGFTQPGANLTLDKNFQVDGKRNGNLQIGQLYSGDVQPSLLAANISQSLLLGAGRGMGDAVVSNDDILGTANNMWIDVGRPGPANYVAADAGGSGTVYILRRINDLPSSGQFRTDFFQVQLNGGIPISRTLGLFQSTADAEGTGQWNNQVRRFSVNPIDKDGIIMGSNAGRLFRSTNMGVNWFEIGKPAVLGNSLITATAFGAPETTTGALNDHIYVGTQSGQIFVTVRGGGVAANWTNISAGLNGSKVEKIITNPTRGTHEAFAVTADGVFRMADWTAVGATWENITANILQIQHLGFGRPEWSDELASTTPGTSAS